jgi:hypothetical protein
MTEQARTFWLIINETIVADGVKFPDGTAAMRWRRIGGKPSTGIYEDLGSIVAIHSRSGFRAAWCDTASTVTQEDIDEGMGFA